MTAYTLTVSTADLGLGILSNVRITVNRKLTTVSNVFPSANLVLLETATNGSGVAEVSLYPDDSTVFHELRIYNVKGVVIYSQAFTMPPQNIALDLVPLQDIISASAGQAVAAAVATAADRTQTGLDRVQTAADRVQTGLDAAAAAADALATAADRVQTGLDAVATAADVVTTAASRDAALLSRGLWQTTAQGIGNGVAGTASLVAGSGGTNGTFALAFSGGTQVIAPEGYFVVAGGSVTQVVITYAGHYSAGVPTLSFAASAGLTGASATSVMGANTPIGQYFSVPVTGSNDFLALYRVDAGPVATEITRYPSSAALDFKKPGAPAGYAFSILDGAGYAAAGIKNDGTFVANSFEASSTKAGDLVATTLNTNRLTEAVPTGFVYALSDAAGRAALGVKHDGSVAIKELSASQITTDTLSAGAVTTPTINGVPVATMINPPSALKQGTYETEVAHIIGYGQSLSVGYLSTPVISTTQPHDTLRFNSGTRPVDALPRTSLVPLVETVYWGHGETPSAGTAVAIKELIALENGLAYTDHKYQLLISADGRSGRSLAELADPVGAWYVELVQSIQKGYDFATAASKTFGVYAMTWTQGEADYGLNSTAAYYIAGIEALRQQVETSANGITGRSDVVKMISYQTGCHKYYGKAYPFIALAQLQASKDYDNIFMACPTYQFAYLGDNLHLPAASSKKLGFYYGLAYKRIVVDGEDWKPLMPISKTVQGKLALVKFNVPMGRLAIDTTTVTANTNYGFNLFDAGGAEVTITSVEITSPDTVKIVSPVNITAGFKLQYAFYGTGTTGSSNGPRGNLRDTQGDTIVFDPTGLNFPAHNWCVMFEEIF